jgi:hypothetical protein
VFRTTNIAGYSLTFARLLWSGVHCCPPFPINRSLKMRKFLLAMAASAVVLPASAGQLVFSTGATVFANGQVSDYAGKPGLNEERFAFNKGISTCVQTTLNMALPPGTDRASYLAGVPIADTSCYAVVPDLENKAGASSVTVDIAPASASPILYFGLYWGSMDPYNYITLESRPDKTNHMTPILISGLSQPDGTINGSDLLTLLGKPAGYSTYVSFRFGAGENFQRITLGSTHRAFEVDNLAYSVNDFLSVPPPGSTVIGNAPAAAARSLLTVPEPSAGGIVAMALGLIAIGRRRRA